jgi:hypothetical protein
VTPILGPGSKLRGYFLEDSSTTKILSPGGTVLGIYNKIHDFTTTAGNSFIGYGNQLMTLLED